MDPTVGWSGAGISYPYHNYDDNHDDYNNVYDDDNDNNDDMYDVFLYKRLSKHQIFYLSPKRSKKKSLLLPASLNSFQEIGEIGRICQRKECRLKFEYHQGQIWMGGFPKAGSR